MQLRWRRSPGLLVHEGGQETIETIAVIGVSVALLVAVMLALSGSGGSIGGAALERLGIFISQGAQTQQQAAQPVPAQQPVVVVAMGVPNLLAAQVGAPPQAQQTNWIVNLWQSLPLWAQGALIAAAAALVVGLIFVGLVALGVLTFVSLPVAAVIAAVGVALAAIAGAIYAVWTGKIDVVHLILIGSGVQLLTIGVAWLVASGAAAAAVAWVRAVAWPWVTRTVSGVARGLWQRVTGAVGWVRNTALPWVTRTVSGVARGLWQRVTGAVGWVRNTALPWVGRQIVAGLRFTWRVVSWPFRFVWGKLTQLWRFITNKAAVEAWLKKNPFRIPFIARLVEEILKGSYVEGLVLLLVITMIEAWAKGNAIVYLLTFLIYAALKGLYGRYKEDIHKWLQQHFPWLPLPKLP
jgi:hypothetical protein